MIEIGVTGAIAKITMNNPEKRNRLNMRAMRDLAQAFQTLNEDPAVRVLIVTGSGGPAFCAGADLSEFDAAGVMEHRRQNEAYRDLCLALFHMRKPVVAGVNGIALAGGMALVTLAHLAVASETARFGAPEINVGTFPNMVMAGIFRSIGRKAAHKLVLLGEMMDAGEALEVGLVNKVVPFDKLDEAVGELAEKLASKSPSTMMLGLDSIRMSNDLPYPQALEYLKDVATLIRNTEDCREGAKAFMEKREPRWKGQ